MTAPTDAERASQAVDRLTATFADINGVHAAGIFSEIKSALASVRAEERERAARDEPTPEYFARAALDAAAHALAEATLLVETSATKHTGACRSRRFVQNTKCARCQEIDAQRDGLDLYREARSNLDAIRRQEG